MYHKMCSEDAIKFPIFEQTNHTTAHIFAWLKLKAIKTLNVIQLIDSLAAGGAEMMAVNTANALNEVGITSHLCATRKEGVLKKRIHSDVGYLFLNKRNVFDVKAIIKLARYCKTHKITHIHAHSSGYVMAVFVKVLLPKIKIVWHDHYGKSEQLNTRSTVPLAWVSYFFSAAIAVNSKLLQWGKATLHVKNYVYIPNFAMPQKASQENIVLQGIQGKRIVCVANFRPQKDHLNLITAFEHVQIRHSDWTLHLIGTDDGDAYAEQIHNAIAGKHLQDCVFCYGSCKDTARILDQAAIGVLASQSEGLPLALLEYGLHGLPVVVTNVGECAAVVENGQSGLVVPASNAKLLANALDTLMTNENLRSAFGKELSAKVAEQYSKNTYISTLKTIYTHV